MTRSTVTRSTAKRSTAKIGPSIERKELPRCLNPCTLCVIRKRRCDAQTPCENCTKRGAANQCRRRPRRSLGTASPGRTLTSPNQNQPSSQSSSTQSSLSSVRSESPTPEVFAKQALPSRPRSSGGVEDVQQDVAVTLDFPPLSRRQLVQAPQKYEEMFFTAKQINDLLIFHGGCLAWIHNVVHLPSFRDQCQSKLAGDELPTDKTWDALYYSMLAVRIPVCLIPVLSIY
ncbi:C6 transcription factor [Penicillium malachiteum]|uniref:C6 transcription factor n=1 Tax=Penicillium malachiteum TaxID=1324776 RepID=UPI0025476FD2|nr:C6 transcription factor [Penicillium malachiteum]KAJ5713135.1 C6 transcription factor [Penicillium malachiteum]